MKVFISYHRADTIYKNQLVQMLDDLSVPYYVVPEDYNFDGMFHQHVAQIILDNITDCTVTICIVGKETYRRPHVDHEIKATLRGGPGIRNGLIAVMLESRGDSKRNIDRSTFPARIADNIGPEHPYVIVKQWASIKSELRKAIQQAESNRGSRIPVHNNRPLMNLRTGRYYDN